MPAAGPRRVFKPLCGIGTPACGQRAVAAVAAHTYESVDAARSTATPSTGVVFLCVEHHGWFPHAVRPLTRLPAEFPAEHTTPGT